MRTAVTIAREHGSDDDVLLSGRNVPIHEQTANVRALVIEAAAADMTHPTLAEVTIINLDGQPSRVWRFGRPAPGTAAEAAPQSRKRK